MLKSSLAYMGLDEWKAKSLDGTQPEDVILCKTFVDTKIKLEGDESGRRVRITMSTKAVDRDNDTIDPAGWNIQNYRRNPVVLWAHQAGQPPIARAVDIIQNDERLSAVDEFVSREVYPFGDTVFQLIKGGFLHASSVGFKPKKSAFVEDRRGFDFTEQELLEHSIVPVPSNPEALIEARSALGNDVVEPMLWWCEETLDTWHGEKGLWLPKSKVEQVFDTLNTTTHFDMAPRKSDDVETVEIDGQQYVCGLKGENLASLLNNLIDARTSDDRSRADVIASMASEAGISSSTVNGILRGDINCPPLSRLQGFARALNTRLGRLRSAAESDGCNYGERFVDTTEKALEILTSIEEKLTALLGQKQTDESGAVEPEIVEEEENDLNDVFASLTQGMNNNALLAEIDETQLRGAMRQALGELIPDLVKTQYTSITGRLVD